MLNTLLRLERNLAVCDCESTGLDPAVDRIIQLAITIHYPHREPIAWWSFVNPGIPILNTAIHGVSDADVADAPTFAQMASALATRLQHVDIAGFYVQFDIDFLRVEMKRAGVSWEWDGCAIDAHAIFRQREPHSLINAYKRFVDSTGFKGEHTAAQDVVATEAVAAAQLKEYADLPRTVKELSEYCNPQKIGAVDRGGKIIWQGNEAVLNFGKHKGITLRDVPLKYLDWLLTGDFSTDVKIIVQAALNGEFPTGTV